MSDETEGLEQLEEDPAAKIATLVSKLKEQVYLISNALGDTEAKEGKGKDVSGKLNLKKVTQTASKPLTVTKQSNQKLMPNHMLYKDEDAPVEEVEEAEDSHDKDLEAVLEGALEALKRYKHTLQVSEEAATMPIDERL